MPGVPKLAMHSAANVGPIRTHGRARPKNEEAGSNESSRLSRSQRRSWDDVAEPTIEAATDAIVKVDTTTISGTDLHILKGDLPAVKPGTILGHWIRDVTVKTGLVDTRTIPQLLSLIAGGRLDPTVMATHRFPIGEAMEAYDVFAAAASTQALKVVLQGSPAPVAGQPRVPIGTSV